MSYRPILALGLSSLVLATALSGCGDSTSGASSSSSASAKAAGSSAPAGSAAGSSAAKTPDKPKEKSAAAKFCLGPDGTSQDCGISCKVDKDPETCAKWAEKTKDICAKIKKSECQEICDKDENPTACELAKAMK